MQGAFSFNGVLDQAFLFVEDIWHDVQKGSGSILSSISFQNFAVSQAINDMVDLCPNLWCNNPKATFLLDVTLFDLALYKYIFLTKNTCFLCEVCARVTTFFLLLPNYTVQNPFWDKQVCYKFINVMIKNNPFHRSGSKITLCNVAMKVSILSLHIIIWNLNLWIFHDLISVYNFNIFIHIF